MAIQQYQGVTLPKWVNRTQAEIAKQCDASQSFVSKVLKELNYDSHKNRVNQPVERTNDGEAVRIRTVSRFPVTLSAR
jgi:hypothetical protein